MRKVALSLPGVGCRSSQNRCIHATAGGGALRIAAFVAIALPHYRYSSRTNAKQHRVRVLNANTHGKSRREMNPVERAVNIWQTTRDFAVFRKNSEADTFHNAVKLP